LNRQRFPSRTSAGLAAKSSEGEIVAASKADKAMEYVDYAKHCLKAARRFPDRETRMVFREMAAAWTALAGEAVEQEVVLRAQAARPAKKPAKARS
jgi:hypothetical protein